MIPDSAVKAIQDSVRTEVIDVDGLEYLTRPVAIPPADPQPDRLTVHTLTGLIEFINNVADKALIKALHVTGYDGVDVIGAISGRHQQRPTFASASVKGKAKFTFNQYMEAEDFIIGLQTGFVKTANLEQVLSIVGTLKDENVTQIGDDGITQGVTTKKGISLGQQTVVPNPVILAPYRTFPEIAQPESPYVLRLKRKEGSLPLVALYATADQGWEIEAIQSIRQFLSDAVKNIPIIA